MCLNTGDLKPLLINTDSFRFRDSIQAVPMGKIDDEC